MVMEYGHGSMGMTRVRGDDIQVHISILIRRGLLPKGVKDQENLNLDFS